ncbi:MAG: response regulator transcription factor [Acidimicrobiia bacterium]|nr:response regulator transcription factor [Acidimicrobiia bacterium]
MTATQHTHQVLVVDDEPMVREVVAQYLEREGFSVRSAADGAAALLELTSSPPDVVVLDIMLPLVGGLDVLTEVRRQSDDIAVILLSAKGEEEDRVHGLDLGADDYVVKPFSPRELTARVRSVLRRAVPNSKAYIGIRGLTVDPSSRIVLVDDTPVDVTRREFDLLSFLAHQPGQVFSRAQLLDHVWDSSTEWQDPATVTVHVRRLRAKLGGDPDRFIETVWGVGYRFKR